MHSWRVLILPFIDGADLYDTYDFSEPWDGPNNRKLIARIPQWLVFPGDARNPSGVTNYLAVVGPETVWPGSLGISFGEVAEPSKTIMVVENRGAGVQWTEPRDLNFATMNFNVAENPSNGISSRFDRPAVACADGCIRGIPKDVQPETLRARLTVTRTDDIEDKQIIEWPNGRNLNKTHSANDEFQ